MALQVTRGTPIKVSDAVGDDYHITIRALGNNAGRQSDQIDLGAAAGTRYYEIAAQVEWAATPTVGQAARFYLKETIDGTALTGVATNDDLDGSSEHEDAAVSAEDKLKNLLHLGNVVCDEAAANIPTARLFGIFKITSRYVNIVVWNAGGAALNTVNDTDNIIWITPITYQDA